MIPSEILLAAVKKAGLKAVEQAAFWKVASGECAIYIAKTQKVSRVDLSGFNIKHSACTRLTEAEAHKLKVGNVRGQLDFSKSEDRVLEAFLTSLTTMKQLAKAGAREDKAPKRKAVSSNRRTPKVAHPATTQTPAEAPAQAQA